MIIKNVKNLKFNTNCECYLECYHNIKDDILIYKCSCSQRKCLMLSIMLPLVCENKKKIYERL